MSASFFWEESERTVSKPVPVEAQPVILWKCGRCFVNLPTEGNVANTVKCTHCGVENSITRVNWSGQH